MALTNKIIDIAEAIRNKTNTTDKLTLDEMPTKIASIETGSAEPVLQDKSVTITENGTTNIVADEGYGGLNNVEVITNIEGGNKQIQYITSMKAGTPIGTPPNYLNTGNKNRATYLEFDIKITPSKKYKIIGQEAFEYRVLQVDEETANAMKNGETVPNEMFIADTGYMGTHEFEVTAIENAAYLWCMCRNPNDYEATIELEKAVPVYIEEISGGEDVGKLLWTNPYPKAGFTSQKVTFKDNDYDILEIYFVNSTSQNYMQSQKFIKKWSGRIADVETHGSTVSSITMRNVTYNASDDSYTFSSGLCQFSNGQQYDSNDRVVPIYIVGYKTGLFD